jgi:hypothetical protein
VPRTKQQLFADFSRRIVNFVWDAPPLACPLDYSARESVARQLIHPLMTIDAQRNPRILEMDIASAFHHNSGFTEEVIRINESVISASRDHFTKYGGRNALFAYCLSRSLAEPAVSAVERAKSSVLIWYLDQREVDRKCLDGPTCYAWFPYHWFAERFGEFAMHIIAESIFHLSVAPLIDHVRETFMSTFSSIRRTFREVPEPVLAAKGQDMSMEDFQRELQQQGLERYFYLFQLNRQDLLKIASDFGSAMHGFLETLGSQQKHALAKLIDGPQQITTEDPNAVFNELRELRIVEFVELGPNQIFAVLYPTIS